MNKIITIELTGKGDTYSVVTLPLTPYELLDTLDKLRMTPQDEPDWEICQHLAHRELHDWIGGGSVYELNALCTKLAELNDQESTVFEGLVEMEKQKGEHIIPMHRLLDLAYSTGQCHLLDEVHSTEQLGRFAAENGFIPEADDLPDKAFKLLDFKKLGEQFMRGEGGVIVRGGYVAQDGDLAQDVWKTLKLTPRKPDYAVLVELIAPEPSDNVTLALPATAEALTKAMTLTNARNLSETPCLCLDCRAPTLRDMITDANSLADACRAAESLASLPDADLPKYKALLAAMEIRDLHEAIELSQRLDDYTLSPEQSDYRVAQAEHRLACGDRWQNSGYLFTNETGGPMNPTSITAYLRKFSERYGLPHINPHAFRHTVASVLIANGTDIVTVSKQLGHAQVSTTSDVYSHVIEAAKAEATECIADVLLRRKQA